MQNKLLNFRQGARTIKIIKQKPEELYETLILKEKKSENEMQFLNKPENNDKKDEYRKELSDIINGHILYLNGIELSRKTDLTDEEIIFTEALVKNNFKETIEDKKSILWELPSPKEDETGEYRNTFLKTELNSKELQKRLFYINQHAKSVLEEQGYNILYLALGFLKWMEKPEATDYRKAPLILIPVELDRKRVKGSFKLRWNGEDIITNISLKARLKEIGIYLPEFKMPETKENITEYLDKIREIITTQKKDWKVTDEVNLGFFSFTKFVMYKDLDQESWPGDDLLIKSPVIQEIFNPSDNLTDGGFNEDDVDKLLSSKETFHVVDADSSQIAVIEDIKNGHNMVVEGPPGTGKSQTIVNLIAELIAAGKTVLFVSEKMAALEVVKSRLNDIELGEFCLELHSHKSRKKEVLNELESTINNTRKIDISLEKEFYRIEKLKSDLNNYVEVLHEPFNETGFTPFHLYGLKEKSLQHFDDINRKLPRFHFNNPRVNTLDDWNQAYTKIKELSELLKYVKPLSCNPWSETRPGPILPVDQEEIEELTREILKHLTDLKSQLTYLNNITGVRIPEALNEIPASIENSLLIAESQPLDEKILQNKQWNEEEAYKIIEDLETLNSITSKYKSTLSKEEIKEQIKQYKGILTETFKFQDNHATHTIKNVNKNIEEINSALQDYDSNINHLIMLTGVNTPGTLNEVGEVIKTADLISESVKIDKKILLNNQWHNENQNIYNLIKELERFQNYRAKLFTRIDEKILDENIESILNDYKKQSSKLLKFLNHDLKKIKENLTKYYKTELPSNNDDIINDLEDLHACQELRGKIRGNNAVGRELFSEYWNDEETDAEFAINFTHWIIPFRELLTQNKISENALNLISKGVNTVEIKETVKKLELTYSQITGLLNELNKEVHITKSLTNPGISDLNPIMNNLRSRMQYYQGYKENIQSLYNSETPIDDDALIKDADEFLNSENLQNKISKYDGAKYFGICWIKENSDTKQLRKLTEWIIRFKDLSSRDELTGKAIELVNNGVNTEDIKETISIIKQLKKLVEENINKLEQYLHFNLDVINVKSINKLYTQIESYKNEVNQLLNWSRFNYSHDELEKTIAYDMIKLIDKDKLEPEDLIPCLEGNYADALLTEVFTNTPEISQFIGKLHEEKISTFQELDNKLIKLNRSRIIKRLYDNRPSLYNSVSPRSQLGILKSEFTRKRGHMPLRQLFLVAGNLIQDIKPCFMMSPLSIAQYLDPNGITNLRFDYVVFDEASQMKPEDALGALLRANKAVVMGDTKQLPPTTFFENLIGKDDELDYELSTISDMESILHLCKRSFPTKMLKWHYRSRHESLIAVSNQQFYGNELLIYPSPSHESEELGLKFEYLPESIYDRGSTSTNRKEAETVIQKAFEHYKKYGHTKSLGIGTFNVRQQQAILEELELQLKLNPGIEKYFSSKQDEHFFVKNLETIQGDERDVILISIGYGFDANHHLSLNFGPLNQEGGERRLNVLITRAREQCVIFANFKSRDIEIKPNAAFGLKALKIFLEYAETKNLGNITSHGKETESPFEESVYKFLTDKGYKVHKQVGCADFRIDLAILDMKHPGKYLLGIECDGVMYHSSPVARDRDRLRQQVLEGLGWTFHRIWSTDWYRDRVGSQKKLLKAIEEAEKTEITETIPIEIDSETIITTPVEDENILTESTPVNEEIVDYTLCESLNINTNHELYKKSIKELSEAVIQIVEIEGPIHQDEVITRIRTIWGLKKAGRRIQNVLNKAITKAQEQKLVIIRDNFLYSPNQEIHVRNRINNRPSNLNYICNEEITAAIKLILKQPITPEELTKQVANLFGVKVVRAATHNRINDIINTLINEGNLEKQDEMIQSTTEKLES